MKLRKIVAYRVTRTPRSSSGMVKFNAETMSVYDSYDEAHTEAERTAKYTLNADIAVVRFLTYSR